MRKAPVLPCRRPKKSGPSEGYGRERTISPVEQQFARAGWSAFWQNLMQMEGLPIVQNCEELMKHPDEKCPTRATRRWNLHDISRKWRSTAPTGQRISGKSTAPSDWSLKSTESKPSLKSYVRKDSTPGAPHQSLAKSR